MFLYSILCCTQIANDSHEDLAKFGHKLNMKKRILLYLENVIHV